MPVKISKTPIIITHKDQEYEVTGVSVDELSVDDLCQACVIFGAKFPENVNFIGESICLGITNGYVVFKKKD